MRNIDPKKWVFSANGNALINLETEQVVKKKGLGEAAKFCFYSSKDAEEPYCQVVYRDSEHLFVEDPTDTVCHLDDFWEYLNRIFTNGFDYSDYCLC